MTQSGLSLTKLAASSTFGVCVVALLVLDTAIISSGQIGFITVMLYYAVFVTCATVYWIAAIKSGVDNLRLIELLFTAAFAVAPLTLRMYGYGGPT